MILFMDKISGKMKLSLKKTLGDWEEPYKEVIDPTGKRLYLMKTSYHGSRFKLKFGFIPVYNKNFERRDEYFDANGKTIITQVNNHVEDIAGNQYSIRKNTLSAKKRYSFKEKMIKPFIFCEGLPYAAFVNNRSMGNLILVDTKDTTKSLAELTYERYPYQTDNFGPQGNYDTALYKLDAREKIEILDDSILTIALVMASCHLDIIYKMDSSDSYT